MPSPRDVLNALKWRDRALDEAVVTYTHRGAPGDVRVIRGSEIEALHPGFMEVRGRDGSSMIPYHRVERVEREDAVVWERRAASVGRDDEDGEDADDAA